MHLILYRNNENGTVSFRTPYHDFLFLTDTNLREYSISERKDMLALKLRGEEHPDFRVNLAFTLSGHDTTMGETSFFWSLGKREQVDQVYGHLVTVGCLAYTNPSKIDINKVDNSGKPFLGNLDSKNRLDNMELEAIHGKGEGTHTSLNQIQQKQAQKDYILKNIEDSKKARESSNFGEYLTKEKEILVQQQEKNIISTDNGFQVSLEKKYIDIRGVGYNDICEVAKNSGLTVQEVYDMKNHLFVNKHKLSVDGKPYEEKYFQADQDVAYGWKEAQKGKLTTEQKEWFQQLKEHELTEKGYMDEGMPLKDKSTWSTNKDEFLIDSSKNAHDKANLTAPQPSTFPGVEDKMFDDFLKYDNPVPKYPY